VVPKASAGALNPFRGVKGVHQVNALSEEHGQLRLCAIQCRVASELSGSMAALQPIVVERASARETEISMESLILAQDERWRRA
jgi:hypothetical protein